MMCTSQFKIQKQTAMDIELNEEQKSMMRSVSKNIMGKFDLNPQPVYTGQHGQIFYITNQTDRQSLILKVIWKSGNQLVYKNQKRIHYSLKNRYIVQLQNCFGDEINYYLVLEHCKKGSLRQAMTKKLSLDTARQYAHQIAKGIHYLHKSKVIHHDIKPENILLTEDNQIKICDFGLAVQFEDGKSVKGCQGTLAYAPPQAIELHNEKFDVWSLGCVIFEMITGSVPFSFQSWKELSSKMNQQYLKNYPYDSVLPSSLVNLLKKIFVYNKKERISIDEVLKHSFFTGDPLEFSEIQHKHQERPLAKKKHSQKVIARSVELKSTKNKQNIDRCNRLDKQKKTTPNYRQILQHKFKRSESEIESSKKGNSGKKMLDSKKEVEQFKGVKQVAKPSMQTLFNFREKSDSCRSRKINVSPLNTCNMRINPLKIKSTEIRIDEEGITRERHNKEGVNQLINISCDGRSIKMRKGKKEKIFLFDQLPPEYLKEYEECKNILREIQSQQPRICYLDKNFRKHQTLEIKIMYNGKLSVTVEDELSIKDLSPEQLLENSRNIDQGLQRQLANIYLRLAEMHKLI